LPGAQESSTVLSPQALKEIAQVEGEIDRIEAQTIERLATPPDNQVQQIELLGKLMLYDKQLSVNATRPALSATCRRWASPVPCRS
jgi:cytochrome c peroxidase